VSERTVRAAGLAATIAYASFVVWAYQRQPQTIAQVTGGLAAGVGAYRIDALAFEDGLRSFRGDRFVEARAAFQRADRAERDARTQFYIAYSYYRQGWGRLYHDDELYARGLEAIDKAIALAPNSRLVVDDPALAIRTGDELRAELEAGIRRDLSDVNPLRLFGRRK
jgi:tetratricopeptide (TPR) repeat protein